MKKTEIIVIKKEDLRYKPRTGVHYTKIVPDKKTNYSRNKKHKKSDDQKD